LLGLVTNCSCIIATAKLTQLLPAASRLDGQAVWMFSNGEEAHLHHCEAYWLPHSSLEEAPGHGVGTTLHNAESPGSFTVNILSFRHGRILHGQGLHDDTHYAPLYTQRTGGTRSSLRLCSQMLQSPLPVSERPT
jgi:hypothetical protein